MYALGGVWLETLMSMSCQNAHWLPTCTLQPNLQSTREDPITDPVNLANRCCFGVNFNYT
jgi:hypothetical protein